jgi:hypothetical protein
MFAMTFCMRVLICFRLKPSVRVKGLLTTTDCVLMTVIISI